MNYDKTKSTHPIKLFWDKYIQHIEKKGIKKIALRWYVKNAEQYIKEFPEKKLATHKPEDITDYLNKLGKMQIPDPHRLH